VGRRRREIKKRGGKSFSGRRKISKEKGRLAGRKNQARLVGPFIRQKKKLKRAHLPVARQEERLLG